MPPIFAALFAFLGAGLRSRASLQLEVLALRHQLAVYQRSVKRPRLKPADRLLWVWPSGVGKSHLAQALAHEACRRGHEVLFVSTAKMLTHLAGGRADGTLAHRLTRYLRPALLCLDDFGLKPLRAPGPEDLYDIIHERYERAAILLTSNRHPSEWTELFGEPLLASAALDRLTHRAHFLEITGPSYRAEQTKQHLTQRRTKPSPTEEQV